MTETSSECILVVDDDPRIRRLLQRYLQRNGMTVLTAESGDEMHPLLAQHDIDLLLLDLMMPGEDGLSLAKAVRQKSDVPIIILTGKADTVDKVVGLEVGADDYVTKPFDERELLARVRSVLRRHNTAQSVDSSAESSAESSSSNYTFGRWTLNSDAHELQSQQGESVHLTKHEFILLKALVQRPNRIWTRNEILDLVAEREYQTTDRSIDVLVGKLRKKIEQDPKSPQHIHTVRGVGYKFSL